jgi:hypothetical protein
VKVTDHAGNVTEEEVSIEGIEEIREAAPTGPDTTAPTITFLGSAVEAVETGATSGKYELRMLARDGSPSAPQSGVSKIEVAVDGTTVQSWEKYCPVGSCRLKIQWPYTPASFTGTGHVLTVTVRDHAGNVTTRTIGPDTTPPVIELGGALTEGFKQGITEYPLHVRATDGGTEQPGSGLKSIAISVDGKTVESKEQGCPGGSCAQELSWTFSRGIYPGLAHVVHVLATDQAGNLAESVLELSEPNGSIPACSPTGAPPKASPEKTEALPGGGTLSIYRTAGGKEIAIPTPPSNFKPLTASAAELEEYAFAPRPSDPTEKSEWEAEMKAYKHAAPPALCNGVPGTAAEVSGLHESESANWSGFEAQSTNPAAWAGASANWNQVHYNKPYCPEGTETSWVGLGGAKGKGLLQVGSEISAAGNYYSFYNFLGKNTSQGDLHLGVVPAPGDEIHAAINYYPNLRAVAFELYDLTQGVPVHQPLVFNQEEAEEFYYGATADFIVERNAVGESEFSPLLDYGTAQWFKAKAKGGAENWHKLGEVNRRRVVMQENGGTILSEPGFIAESDPRRFETNWKHCHP